MSYDSSFLYRNLSYQILGCAFTVHSSLGSHLPEKVYENALVMEFQRLSIPYTRQKQYEVTYDGTHCGHFFTDLIVNNQIILELKSDEFISSSHQSQLFTYLRVCNLKVGYILNFGRRSLQFKRLIL